MGTTEDRPDRVPARRYRPPGRERQARRTRAGIVAAAQRRFLEHGYAGTTMRAVARDAGVALPTVELAFGTKARLLKAVIDTAIAGDDEPVPMLARGWAAEAEAATDPAAFVAVFARVLVESAGRAAGVTLAALEGARVDGDMAAVADQLMAQREVMAAWLVDGLLRRSPLRAGVDRASAGDTVWALMDPAVFHRLTGDRGWSRDRFRRWFTGSVLRLLPEDRERVGAGAARGVQPELWVDRAATAVAFYQAAFGAAVLHQVGEGEDVVAQLAVGGAAFWVSAASADGPRRSPNTLGCATARTLLVVDDPDTVFQKAVAAGATPTAEPADEHGWRLGRIVDPFGQEWEIGKPAGSWPPRW